MLKHILPTSELIYQNFTRSFTKSSLVANQQSNLFKLRKSTGYALTKCKEALEKHNGNVEEATKWLNEQAQKEGWTRAEKLKNRQTSQGTLVFVNDKTLHRASIVELNCETDFVARNDKFLDLSSQIALAVTKNAPTVETSKKIFFKEELNKLGFDSNKTIGDQIALAIGSIGENMSLRRAVIFNVKPTQYISWYMHGSNSNPMNNCHFGKYGALVNISLTQHNENYKPFEIGKQLAQHIVGLKPSTMGEMPAESVQPPSGEPVKIDENETRFLYQEFLMRPNTRVLDFLREHHAVINDYIRFETGEPLDTESNN